MNPNPYSDEDLDDDIEKEPLELTKSVLSYLKHLKQQEEWADVEWLPGDLK